MCNKFHHIFRREHWILASEKLQLFGWKTIPTPAAENSDNAIVKWKSSLICKFICVAWLQIFSWLYNFESCQSTQRRPFFLFFVKLFAAMICPLKRLWFSVENSFRFRVPLTQCESIFYWIVNFCIVRYEILMKSFSTQRRHFRLSFPCSTEHSL